MRRRAGVHKLLGMPRSEGLHRAIRSIREHGVARSVHFGLAGETDVRWRRRTARRHDRIGGLRFQREPWRRRLRRGEYKLHVHVGIGNERQLDR